MFTSIAPKISAIPTNLITGFLGTGKTTAILKLLASKPKNENWAVLVNEFGEVGIDAALIKNKSHTNSNDESSGVYIREVPGGCMCCASGVPMQVALNQLIKKSKPDRLLIEPTGLGHPKEIVEVLTSKNYQPLISLESVVCLVDARNINDDRFTTHPSFVQQLTVADVIISAKADQYSLEDTPNLLRFISNHKLTDKPLHMMKNGAISLAWLTVPKSLKITKNANKKKGKGSLTDINVGVKYSTKIDVNNLNITTLPNPLAGKATHQNVVELHNNGEGFYSKGWIFSNNYTFHLQALLTFIRSLKITRIKAVMITEQGCYTFNKANVEFTYNKIPQVEDSRIELIDINKSLLDTVTQEQLQLLNTKEKFA